jgi:hypothetical protein
VLPLLLIAQTSLSAEAGETIFVNAELEVDEARGELKGSVKDVRAGSGLGIAPFVEVVERKPGAVVVRYAIEIAPDRAAGTDTIEATLQVDADGRRIAKKSIAHELAVTTPTPTPEEIARERDAVREHVSKAEQRGAKPKTVAHHELRSEAARRRLLAAARAEDPAVELAAIHAIGSLAKGASRAPKPGAESMTTEAVLDAAAKQLDALAIDEAESALIEVRRKLVKKELAVALQLLGAIELAKGDDEDSRRAFGQALCADPGLQAILKRRAFQTAFEAAKAQNPCREPIRIQEIHVERDQGKKGLVIEISATFGDDPFGLVEYGDVQIWGTGGGMFASDRPRSIEKNGQRSVLGEIDDNGKMETYDGQILVKVFLRDSAGVVIDSFGDPDPVPRPIESGGDLSSTIPWWVWIVTAGVAVAAGATVTAIVLTRDDGEPPLGIGPIEVTF